MSQHNFRDVTPRDEARYTLIQQFLLLYNESAQFPVFQQDVDLTDSTFLRRFHTISVDLITGYQTGVT